jgi:hypothetical protein
VLRMRMAKMITKAYAHLLEEGGDGCSVMDYVLLSQVG